MAEDRLKIEEQEVTNTLPENPEVGTKNETEQKQSEPTFMEKVSDALEHLSNLLGQNQIMVIAGDKDELKELTASISALSMDFSKDGEPDLIEMTTAFGMLELGNKQLSSLYEKERERVLKAETQQIVSVIAREFEVNSGDLLELGVNVGEKVFLNKDQARLRRQHGILQGVDRSDLEWEDVSVDDEELKKFSERIANATVSKGAPKGEA